MARQSSPRSSSVTHSSGSSSSASSVSVGVVRVAGGVAPGAEVVLVEDDAVPVDQVDRLVVGLDLARRRSCRAGPGTTRTTPRGLASRAVVALRDRVSRSMNCQPAKSTWLRRSSRQAVCDRRLVGEDQHPLPAHLACQLVGGEGLAETHLGVPQELRRRCVAGVGAEVPGGPLDGVAAARDASRSRRCARGRTACRCGRRDRGADLVEGRLEPLASAVVMPVATSAVWTSWSRELGAVLAVGRFVEEDVDALEFG